MSKKVLPITIFLAVCLVIGAAYVIIRGAREYPEGHYSGAPLPPTRPTSTVIYYSYGGGMDGRGTSAYLSEKSSYVDVYENGTKKTYPITVSPAELDTLYATFRGAHFENVTWKREEVFDGYGGAISLEWGESRIHKSIGDGIVYDQNSLRAITAVQKAITDLTAQKIKTTAAK